MERFPGTLIEDKEHGFVVHFRLAPAAGPQAKALLDEMLAEAPGGGAFTVLEARMAWEVRPRGASKGTAVRSLMARAPFAGRRPVFIGDDVTDEEGMEAAREHGGFGLRLQDASASRRRCGTGSPVRAAPTAGGSEALGMTRLVIVTNRVPDPKERGATAGGLAIALQDAVSRRDTMWFGWSGGPRRRPRRALPRPPGPAHLCDARPRRG